MKKDNRWCLICQPKNRTLYWHMSKRKDDNGNEYDSLWCWCNKCDRSYSVDRYCKEAGITKEELFSGDITFQEAKHNEIDAMAWPSSAIPLSDPRAERAREYVTSRGLSLDGDMYYDMDEDGIVFPYYYDNHFCGAQIRFIKERITEDGDKWKITTLPGTRLGLLFYGWNQSKFMSHVKGVVVVEGAFNAISINQALVSKYGSIADCPWRAIACSGAGAGQHHQEALKELKDNGYKIILAPDTDEAGLKMAAKFKEADVITHIAFTGDTEKDWNDLVKEMGHEKFANFFLKSIAKV